MVTAPSKASMRVSQTSPVRRMLMGFTPISDEISSTIEMQSPKAMTSVRDSVGTPPTDTAPISPHRATEAAAAISDTVNDADIVAPPEHASVGLPFALCPNVSCFVAGAGARLSKVEPGLLLVVGVFGLQAPTLRGR